MYFEGGEFPFKQKYQAEKNWNLMRLNQIVTQRKNEPRKMKGRQSHTIWKLSMEAQKQLNL